MTGGKINNTELHTCPMPTENLTDMLLELVFCHTHYTTDFQTKLGINIKEHDGKSFINKQ